MDEYLLLPGSDLGMVMFFSNRRTAGDMLTVYRVHLAEPKKKTAANNSKMLWEIAQLGGVAEDILAEMDRQYPHAILALNFRVGTCGVIFHTRRQFVATIPSW